MKKKVLAVLLVIVSVLSLAGCANKGKPEVAVSELLDTIKITDVEKLGTLLKDDEMKNLIEEDAFIQLMKKSNETLDYKIGDVKVEGNKATVNVECTYGDISEIFGTAFESYMQKAFEVALSGKEATEEEIDAMLNDEINAALANGKISDHTAQLMIGCTKEAGEWAIDVAAENKGLEDVITGNLISGMNELANSMNALEGLE